MFADAVTTYVATLETTTSTTYTDLTTTGPAVTLSLVSGQQAFIFMSARVKHSAAAGAASAASWAVSGASTVAASDSYYIFTDQNTTAGHTCSLSHYYTATATGSHTWTMKYKAVVSGTATFLERRLSAKKY
jgi:hypothetical protein